MLLQQTKMVTLCIPVYKNYKGLEACVVSALSGTRIPDHILVIDNGCQLDTEKIYPFKLTSFGYNIGVAKAWNHFILESSDIRIIANDDIVFSKDTIQNFVDGFDSNGLTCTLNSGVNAFSLFSISDELIGKVGFFDETISPNYAYFEDNDYAYRMKLAGIEMNLIETEIKHYGSATIKQYTQEELVEHHKKFELAKKNYHRKWGGLPGMEIYKKPYGII